MIVTLTLNAAVDRVLSVPGFRPEGLLRAELRDLIPAGKGFNVSRVLAEMGVRTLAAGIVGADEVELYSRSFRELGVETLLCAHPGATRSNITILDPESGAETHLRERGPKVPAGVLDRLESKLFPDRGGRASRTGSRGEFLAFCGSLPPGVAPERLGRILALARRVGRRLLVDTSGAALRSAWKLRPEVLSVNAEELAELAGRRISDPDGAASAARKLLAARRRAGGRGGLTILIKLGGEGAVAVTASGAWSARPPAMEVRNTVGAGDAFNAGYLARESLGLPEALAFAVACGSAQAASRGLGRLRSSRAGRLAGRVRTAAL